MKFSVIQGQQLIRMIPARDLDPSVLRELTDSDEEAEILDELEGETDALRIAERTGTPGLDSSELVYMRRGRELKLHGQRHINGAFAYARPSGNRFNGGDRGA